MTSCYVRNWDMTFDLVGVKGVTRVKKVNLANSHLLIQFTWYCHVTHAYGSPKLSLYRLYTKKISEVIWGHKVKYKGQISNNVKWQNQWCQMLPLDKHAKVLTVTSSSDLRLRGQRSKGSNFKQR